MAGEMRRLLEQELAARPAPPIGDLVAESVRLGRQRRNRRAAGIGIAAALATGAVLLVPAVVGGGLPVPGGAPADVGAPGVGQPVAPAWSVTPGADLAEATSIEPVPPAAGEPTVRPGCDVNGSSSTVTALPAAPTEVANCPVAEVWDLDIPPVAAGTTAPATAAGAVELLTRLLPAGRTSGYAKVDPAGSAGAVAVQLQLDRGDGPLLIRFSVSPDQLSEEALAAGCAAGQICYPLAGGGTVIFDDGAGTCLGGRSVRYHRADGTLIRLDLARCGGGPARSTPLPTALTGQETLAVVLDPRWGTRLPADLVREGDVRFGELPVAGTR
ncbi:hypothetical protein O7553_06630 [Solwaraspora sp. WMMA2059]|uniref:hypothetical protein n=2 Tax=unclassified Solwaraspora TaxID=2627926 RepID=UPI00248B19C0|nr:hypothetical protein [Solwaraspora sp. WMMA2059]WBB98588.1 hypothetical protein O7553_06630 [Solwaraspora sp. WMMA2059]